MLYVSRTGVLCERLVGSNVESFEVAKFQHVEVRFCVTGDVHCIEFPGGSFISGWHSSRCNIS